MIYRPDPADLPPVDQRFDLLLEIAGLIRILRLPREDDWPSRELRDLDRIERVFFRGESPEKGQVLAGLAGFLIGVEVASVMNDGKVPRQPESAGVHLTAADSIDRNLGRPAHRPFIVMMGAGMHGKKRL